jgi:hypothetical protein
MLRSILSRATRGRGRTTGAATPRRRSTSGGTAGGSANQEIGRGAKSLLRGASRKKRGL